MYEYTSQERERREEEIHQEMKSVLAAEKACHDSYAKLVDIQLKEAQAAHEHNNRLREEEMKNM